MIEFVEGRELISCLCYRFSRVLIKGKEETTIEELLELEKSYWALFEKYIVEIEIMEGNGWGIFFLEKIIVHKN